MSYYVRNLDETIAYITDCCLATVAHMASLKSKSKSEYARQISIAQTCCDCLEKFNISHDYTRAVDIIGKSSVAKWARKFEI